MRYKNLIGFVWVAVIMSLFTSCLKDINNVYNPGTTAAVVRQHGDSALMMANTRFGWIYSTKLSSYSEGKCLLVSFDYDPSLPENTNAEQKGYYTVTIQGETAVNQQNAESPLTDTHKLLTNEQPILAVNPNDSVLYVKLIFPFSSPFRFISSAAMPKPIAVCPSWPQACTDWGLQER